MSSKIYFVPLEEVAQWNNKKKCNNLAWYSANVPEMRSGRASLLTVFPVKRLITFNPPPLLLWSSFIFFFFYWHLLPYFPFLDPFSASLLFFSLISFFSILFLVLHFHPVKSGIHFVIECREDFISFFFLKFLFNFFNRKNCEFRIKIGKHFFQYSKF